MPSSITIIGFGNRKEMLNEEVERYINLLNPYVKVSVILLKSPSGSFSSRSDLLRREEQRLYDKWPKRSYPVALSEEGRKFDSISFSKWLSKHLMSGVPLLFNIGDAFGLSTELKKKCREVISLSALTLPYRLCYVVLVEQIYRAFTILKGHPYHK